MGGHSPSLPAFVASLSELEQVGSASATDLRRRTRTENEAISATYTAHLTKCVQDGTLAPADVAAAVDEGMTAQLRPVERPPRKWRGTPVTLAGMVRTPQLNGSTGVIRGYSAERGRFDVELDTPSTDPEGDVITNVNAAPSNLLCSMTAEAFLAEPSL